MSLPWCSQEHAALAGRESLWRFLESNEHMGSRGSGVWGKAEFTRPTIGGNPEPASSLSGRNSAACVMDSGGRGTDDCRSIFVRTPIVR